MKLIFLFSGCLLASILSGCKKINPLPKADLKGTWNYSGYSGGFAGLPFKPVHSEGPYIEVKDAQFLITNGEGQAQKCLYFTLVLDSSSNAYGLSGILTVSDTSFMLPASAMTKYFFGLSNDQLSLAPFNCNDCFTYYYQLIDKTFACN